MELPDTALQILTPGQPFTDAQAAAMTALLGGSTVTEAAEVAGVSRQTCSWWVNRDDQFSAELVNRRGLLREAMARRLEGHATRAVDRIAALMDSDDHAVALRAAALILDRCERLPRPQPNTAPEWTARDIELDRQAAADRATTDRILARL